MAYNKTSGKEYARLKRESSKIKGMNWNARFKRWSCLYPSGKTATYRRRDDAAESMGLGYKTSKAEGAANKPKVVYMDVDYCPTSEVHLRRAWG